MIFDTLAEKTNFNTKKRHTYIDIFKSTFSLLFHIKYDEKRHTRLGTGLFLGNDTQGTY